jgi:flagellar biosynthesis protein FlhB
MCFIAVRLLLLLFAISCNLPHTNESVFNILHCKARVKRLNHANGIKKVFNVAHAVGSELIGAESISAYSAFEKSNTENFTYPKKL